MIVVVEDNRGDVSLIQEALREHDVNVPLTVFSDSEHACEFLNALENGADPCPSLFILDLNLPKKSGLEVLRLIRQHRRCASAPVIVLTSSSAEWDRTQSIRAGANQFISKPSNLDDFLALGRLFKQFALA